MEALDISQTALTLSQVLADRTAVERYRGRVELTISGYINDQRELHEIPEVRRFCAKLDDAFPYWFYFLSPNGQSLGLIARCLCSVSQIRQGYVSLGPELPQFMTDHYKALNWLVDNFSLSENLNVEISRKVAEYFGKFEPIQLPEIMICTV